jgi:hypothetical protein
MHHVSGSIALLFGALLVAMVLCLALEEKLHAKNPSLSELQLY